MYPKYSKNVSKIQQECIQNIAKMYPIFGKSVSKIQLDRMFPKYGKKCVQNTVKMYPKTFYLGKKMYLKYGMNAQKCVLWQGGGHSIWYIFESQSIPGDLRWPGTPAKIGLLEQIRFRVAFNPINHVQIAHFVVRCQTLLHGIRAQIHHCASNMCQERNFFNSCYLHTVKHFQDSTRTPRNG